MRPDRTTAGFGSDGRDSYKHSSTCYDDTIHFHEEEDCCRIKAILYCHTCNFLVHRPHYLTNVRILEESAWSSVPW